MSDRPYRPLPIVTQQAKTKCSECRHDMSWPDNDLRLHADCGLVFGFEVFSDSEDYGGLPTLEYALAGTCVYFRPTLRVRLARWLGLREIEMLTFVDGEVVSEPAIEHVQLRASVRPLAGFREQGKTMRPAPNPTRPYQWKM